MDDELVLIAGNPVPLEAHCAYLEVSPKVSLRYALFPPQSEARGTVCLLQGRGECIERHFETIRDLTALGFQVATFDWRGQGGSPKSPGKMRFGHVSSFSRYIDDFGVFMREVVLPDCPPPFMMLGVSMGGHVGLHVIAKQPWFEAAVMVAPLIDIAPKKVPMKLWTVVARFLSVIGLGRLKVPFFKARLPQPNDFTNNPYTSDKTRYLRNMRLWHEAPELSAIAPTIGWVSAALRSCKRLQAIDEDTPLRCPALLVIAGSDSIVSNEAIQQFARYAPGAVTAMLNGARHEVLSERDTFRDQFMAAFEAFVANHARANKS